MSALAVDGELDFEGPAGGGRLSAFGDELRLDFGSWAALRAALRAVPLRRRGARQASLARFGRALTRGDLRATVSVGGRPWASFSPGASGGFLGSLLGIAPFRLRLRSPAGASR